MAGPTVEFWQAHFNEGKLAWDRGAPSPRLLAWLDSGALPAGSRVLVPGCGRGWEVVALAKAGMRVTGVDYAAGALDACATLLKEQKADAVLQQADVLSWQPDHDIDAIWEQTCLCALHPDHWVHYAQQLRRWLRPGGTLAAMFMQIPGTAAAHGVIEGPPYHCDIRAMRALFTSEHWDWPKPPYEQVPHPTMGSFELAVMLTRRAAERPA
jgi:methyl halide transferase